MQRALVSVALALLTGLGGCASCEPERAASAASEATDPSEHPAPALSTPPTPERPPLPTPPLSEAATRRALLAEGRSLAQAGEHASAIERYERALAIAPGDTTLLGELGWALFHAGRLDEAFTATREAYDRADSPRQEGAMLYNLGRIAEALERTPAALELYRRSLAVRPHDTVRARIEALGGQAPADGEVPVEAWVTSSVIEGEPVASLEALCDRLAPGWRTAETSGGDRCAPTLSHRVTAEVAGGILEAGILTLETAVEHARHLLVARTPGGWLVLGEAGADYYGPASMNRGEASHRVELRDVIPGGPLELVVTVSTHQAWATWCEGGSRSTETRRIFGVIGDRAVCYLDVTTASSSSSGTWRTGEGWAAVDEEYAQDVCGQEGDGQEGEVPSEAADGLAELVDPEAAETTEVAIDEAGRVTFTGAVGDRARTPPVALRAPIELARVPCLGPQPDPLFGCPAR